MSTKTSAESGADHRARVPVPGNPGIYRRGRRYSVRVRDARGKLVSRTAATLAEAKRIKAQITADATRGVSAPDARVTVAAYVEEWGATYRGRSSRGIRPETIAEYRRDLDRYAIPFFGRARLGAIGPQDVRAFVLHLDAAGLAPATVRRILGSVRVVFATAREDGRLLANPAQGVRVAGRVQNAEVEEERVRALSPEQVARLVACAPPGQGQLLVRTAAGTGLRIGELLALRWADVDFERDVIRVRSALRHGNRKPPKSRHGIRDVGLPGELAADLRRYRLAARHSLDEHPVFATREGTPHDQRNLSRRLLAPAARRAGLEGVGWHLLRHTYASALLARGATIVQVQRALGHHSPAFTLTVYAHLMPGDAHDPELVSDLAAAPQPREQT